VNPKLALPLGLLALGVLGAAILLVSRPAPERKPEESWSPLVRALEARPQAVQLIVRANGTVVPRTESELVAQVAGEVEWVSPTLVAGGFFAEDDELVRIEVTDYELALESARAAVARSDSEASRSRKERDRQRRLADQSVASQARIDDAESAYRQAAASLREARAARARAERDLERTRLRAPFDGRVRQERVDAGQFLNRGDRVATLYAVDYAEVRLPVPDRELAHLDLSLAYPHDDAEVAAGEEPESGAVAPHNGSVPGPEVVLRAEFAGRDSEWRGRVVRTEGEIDPKSRMVNVVARVDDPYGRDTERSTPLAVGLFVEAEILGRRLPRAYVVPRTALYEGSRVVLIDAESRLRFREVEVLKLDREEAVLGPESLRAGERVCVSVLSAPVEGMHVRVVGDEPAPEPAPEAKSAADAQPDEASP